MQDGAGGQAPRPALVLSLPEFARPGAMQALRSEANSSAVVAVQADLATVEGVDKLYQIAQDRKVDLLMANAGV
jgi:short-subunit dehydrogenase